MELNDIIYNALLLVGFFAIGFVTIGMIFSRNQRKAFEDRLEKIHPTMHPHHITNDKNLHRSIVNNAFHNPSNSYHSLNASGAVSLDRSFNSYNESNDSNTSSIYEFH